MLLVDDVWARPGGLSRRDRAIVTLAALVARVTMAALPMFLARALAPA